MILIMMGVSAGLLVLGGVWLGSIIECLTLDSKPMLTQFIWTFVCIAYGIYMFIATIGKASCS